MSKNHSRVCRNDSLGICHSIGSASLGIKTIGYDDDPRLIDEMQSDFKISEPSLIETFRTSKSQISFL